MRFESVKAYAFGPFKNETLELAPGMNVVYGPNEAGKSSWHAALYAGLCGMRRGRGRAVQSDTEFAVRHRPWGDDTSWDVGAVIVLADGRRVELRHDLAGRVGSSARDVVLAGRDYSSEIMYDGAPDGARWLGLDRRSFLMTACIRQADILGLLNSPGQLQTELQRAADSADRDGTAAEALTRLRNFRTESVGSSRAPTKPLMRSADRLRRAQGQLEQANAQHEEYLIRWTRVDELNQWARTQEHRLDMARAVRAVATASEAADRLERGSELDARFPGGPPIRPSQNDDFVRQVASALTAWGQRPTIREPEGESVLALEARLVDVDLGIAVRAELTARDVEKRLARARELSARFPSGRPPRPGEDDQLLQRIVRALAIWESRPDAHGPAGPTMAELEQELADVKTQLGEAGATATGETRDASSGLLSMLLRAIHVLFTTLFRLFGSGRRGPSISPEQRQALEERRELIRQRIVAQEEAVQRWEERTRQAREAADAVLDSAMAAGLDANSPAEAAASLFEWQQHRTERLTEIDSQMGDWEELQQLLAGGTLDHLAKQVAAARDEAVDAASRTDAEALAATLKDAGTVVPKKAPSGEQRIALLHHIEERRRQDREHGEAIASVVEAATAVTEAARLTGVEDEGVDAQVARLRFWQEDRKAELKKADQETEEWEELQRVLGQDSLDELVHKVERLQREARDLVGRVGIEDMARLGDPPTDAESRDAESSAKESREAVVAAQTDLEALARDLMDVAEADEILATAKAEYHRVDSLNRTLDLTISFLEQAEERVHRTIAPVLAGSVQEWLPRVTGGRYTDCRLDPERLAVEVATANGLWQRAEVLSHGTAAQVYLLLRLALSRHLASEGCPLILDDAVTASDSQRKRELLETLLALSESTQVVLFTHEEDVCAWARERLVVGPHKLTELAGPDG